MRKNIKIIAILAITALLSGGYFYVYKKGLFNNVIDKYFKSPDKTQLSNKDNPQPNVEDEERIKDVKVFDKAEKDDDLIACKDIADSYTRDLCYSKIAEKLSDRSGCDNIEEEITKNTCYFVVQKNKAIKAKNIEPCKELDGEEVINTCISQVKNMNFCPNEECINKLSTAVKGADFDKDGLTDEDEINKYHTDSKKADTDGDGYSDGDEVKNGFNPNGEGKL